VLIYTGYTEAATPIVERRALPVCFVPLVINFGAPFWLRGSATTSGWQAASSFVAGLHERHAFVRSGGGAFCLQVDLTPAGAHRLLGAGMHELAGQVVDLDALLGSWAKRLATRLYDAPGWAARFTILDAALTQRLEAAPPTPKLVEAAWAAIRRDNGAVKIGVLAQALGCSRKHLNEVFQHAIGVSPKSAARLTRFENAIQELAAGRVASLSELALLCGYYDQAHFNRDFRAYAGESPTGLVERMLRDPDDERVTFVQDPELVAVQG
jgi:AraC-like DNA-binding protein